MGVLYYTGEKLVDHEEFNWLMADGSIADLLANEAKTVRTRSGDDITEEELQSLIGEGPREFTPIGLGKPMSIRIWTNYLGDLPGWGKKDILVTSGVRGVETFEATARLMNLVYPRASDHEFAEFGAFYPGSPLVYYTQSLVDHQMLLSFELVPDTFDADTVNKVGNLFQKASGLPVFAPAATYLLAGSFIVQMISDLGKAFLETGPTLSDNLRLNFGVGGAPDFKEGLRLIHNDGDKAEFADCRLDWDEDNETWKAKREDRWYEGDAPYMVFSIDGKSEPNLEGFTPVVASAGMIEKFYPSSSGFGALIEQMGEGLELYNDLQFRLKALSYKKRLEGLDPSDPQYAELKKLFDAYRNSIRQDEFKVEPIGSL